MGTRLIEPKSRGANFKRLNSNQQMFCLEMLANRMMNPTEAARASGYKNPAQAANKLMKNKKVADLLGKELNERIKRTKLSADRVLEEVSYCALRDPLALCDENGRIIIDDMRKIPEEMRRCIDGIKLKRWTNPETGETTDTIELRLVSKMAALELAAKHFGLLGPQRHEVSLLPLDFDALIMDQKDSEDPIEVKLLEGTEDGS